MASSNRLTAFPLLASDGGGGGVCLRELDLYHNYITEIPAGISCLTGWVGRCACVCARARVCVCFCMDLAEALGGIHPNALWLIVALRPPPLAQA